jgi:hypothetical protein
VDPTGVLPRAIRMQILESAIKPTFLWRPSERRAASFSVIV